MSLPSYDLHGGIRGTDDALLSMRQLVITGALALLLAFVVLVR